MKRLIITALSLCLFCCNETRDKNNLETNDPIEIVKPVESVKEKKLNISLDISSTVPDKLQCIFVNIELDDNKKGLYIIDHNVEAPNKSENVDFEMSGDYIPGVTQIRLGTKQKEVTIEKMLLTYDNNTVEMYREDIDKYFHLNDQVKFDTITKTLKVKPNGKGIPSLTLRKGFVNKVFDL